MAENSAGSGAMREEYVARINRVIDYIEQHLDEELSLDRLAGIACFSRFHFHRIFKSIVGETLNDFIQRIRAEKAAALLINNPKKSVTEVAFDCGYSGSSAFARAFRDIFGMSASQWRAKYDEFKSNNRKENCNIREMSGNIGKASVESSYYIQGGTCHITWRIHMPDTKEVNVNVLELAEMHVAYVRHIGPYKGDAALFEDLFNKLFAWAGPRDLLATPDLKVMAVYHDDPEVTDNTKLRTSICITVPENTEVGGEIGKMTIAAGKYAMARFELLSDGYEDAWKSIFGVWLPGSGYQPADGPCFEIYRNDPKEHPEGKCVVDICIPVKPM